VPPCDGDINAMECGRPSRKCRLADQNFEAPDVRVLERDLFRTLPTQTGKRAARRGQRGHIPGATHFPTSNDIADTSSPLPHMLPTP